MLSLNIPENRTVEVRVEPAWICEGPMTSSFYLGTRFVEIGDADKIAIQSFQRAGAMPSLSA